MKKLFYLSLLLTLNLISCTNEHENTPIYSCNEEANLWAKKNLKVIKTLTRSEWLDIPNQSYQKAAYVAFSPEQKLNFWLSRFEEILQLDWKEEERKHILCVYNFIKEYPYVFQDECSEEEQKRFDIFIYKWADDAIKNIGWNQTKVASVIATGYPLIDVQGTIQMPKLLNMQQTFSESQVNCDCHIGNVVFIWCGGLSSYCSSSPCTSSSHGCGAMWTESCNGLCD